MDASAIWLRQRFPAFASSDYRRLFWSGFFTAGARWALVLGRGWLVYEMTGRTFAVAAVTFASFLPFVVVGPIAGAVADRVDRRTQLIVATVVSVLMAFVLAGLTLAGVVELWHVIVVALLSGVAQAAMMPARQALIANVVPREHLLNAIALGGVAMHGSRVIGPLFGAVLLAKLGAGAVFLLSAALLTVGLVEIWRLAYRCPPPEPGVAVAPSGRGLLGATRSLTADLREGVRFVASDMRIATVMVLVTFHCGLTMAFDSMMPTLSTMVGGASETYSAILVGIGLGAIAGTVTLSTIQSSAAQGRAVAITGFGSGISMLLLGVAPVAWLVVLAAVLVGATQSSYMVLSSTLIQQVVPDALRGRVIALYMMMASAQMAFLALGFGWFADGVGVRVLLIVPAIVWLAIFTAASVGLPEVRHLLRRGSFIPRTAPVAVAPDAVPGG